MSFFNFWKPKVPVKKFSEALNTAVFTTMFVMLQNKTITSVSHHLDDGAWMFFSDDKYEDFNAVVMVVGLGDIISKDTTILEIADMPAGYVAVRDRKGGDWKIDRIKEGQ